jgi:hypothetical protein
MDVSKLPKLSKTSEAQGPAGPPPIAEPAPLTYSSAPPSSVGWAEAWISIGLGVLLLLVFPNTIRYLCSPASFQQNNPVTDAQGNAIEYIKSVFFWTDLGVTVFAISLILEGFLLALFRKFVPLLAALCVTIVAALFNVFVIIRAYPIIGFPVVCGLAVVVLVYMAMTQWRLIAAIQR